MTSVQPTPRHVLILGGQPLSQLRSPTLSAWFTDLREQARPSAGPIGGVVLDQEGQPLFVAQPAAQRSWVRRHPIATAGIVAALDVVAVYGFVYTQLKYGDH